MWANIHIPNSQPYVNSYNRGVVLAENNQRNKKVNFYQLRYRLVVFLIQSQRLPEDLFQKSLIFSKKDVDLYLSLGRVPKYNQYLYLYNKVINP